MVLLLFGSKNHLEGPTSILSRPGCAREDETPWTPRIFYWVGKMRGIFSTSKNTFLEDTILYTGKNPFGSQGQGEVLLLFVSFWFCWSMKERNTEVKLKTLSSSRMTEVSNKNVWLWRSGKPGRLSDFPNTTQPVAV